jgi:cell division septal protein FtsQ
MIEEESIAILINGITYLTGSAQFAERVRKKIIRWKTQLWLLSIAVWATILYVMMYSKW